MRVTTSTFEEDEQHVDCMHDQHVFVIILILLIILGAIIVGAITVWGSRQSGSCSTSSSIDKSSQSTSSIARSFGEKSRRARRLGQQLNHLLPSAEDQALDTQNFLRKCCKTLSEAIYKAQRINLPHAAVWPETEPEFSLELIPDNPTKKNEEN